MRYANGRIPLDQLVHLGGDHYLPPGTAARWRWLQKTAWEKYGVWLIITPGWNAYRPFDIQVIYKRDMGRLAAAPGYSTHGGLVNGQVVFAIDVSNWAALGWDRFKALCRLAGFAVDFVVPQERWHIGDFNDGWVVPAGFDSTPTINKTTTRKRRRNTMIHAAWRDTNGSIAVQCRPGGKVTLITDFADWAGMSAGSGAEAAQISNEQMQGLLARYGALTYPRFDTGRDNIPPLVYVPKGNGTIYTLVEGRLRPLTDMATVQQFLDLGAPSLTLSVGERDNLLKS